MTRIASMLCVALSAVTAAALPSPSGVSYNWGAQLTVAGYDANKATLSDFPVLVRISPETIDGFLYSQMLDSTTGSDLCFIDMSGNGLPFEIDTWDSQGTSLVWVKLPTMEQGTEFVMCWGGSTSGKSVCGASPFAGYVGVWHMSEAIGTVADSSGHGLTATPTGADAAAKSVAVSGPVGNGRQCSDSASARSYLIAPSYDSQNVGNTFAVSGWFNVGNGQTSASDARVFSRKVNYTDANGWEVVWKNNKKFSTRGASSSALAEYSPEFGQGWKHFFIVYDNKTSIIYENGVQKAQKTNGTAAMDNDKPLGIGGYGLDNNTSQFIGSIDECRLLDAVPSADWVRAEYDSISNPSFLTAGAATPYAASAEPLVGVVATDVQYTNATLIATVGSLGKNDAMTADASWVDATVLVALDDTFSSPLFTIPLARTSVTPSSVSVALVPLVTNTTYWAKVVASNSFNVAGESGAISFTTRNPGFASGTALFTERGFTTLHANATATAFGVGAESATLRLEASTDGFATIAAGQEVTATLATAESLAVSSLVPNTTYSLRVRIRNDWGLDTFVNLPDAMTRAVPFVTTGIGWAFSPDGSTIDITFGVSGIYDEATGTATLTYNGVAQGGMPVVSAGTITWPDIQAAGGTATATVVLSTIVDGVPYSQTFTATIEPGTTAVSVADILEHQSAESSVRVRVGDLITLPELEGTDFYYLGNNRFGSLDGNVLTATEPGILGVFCVTDGGVTTNTLPVIVLPDQIGSGSIYILKDGAIGNSWSWWDEAAKWEKVGCDSNDSWPRNPDDIAIAAYWQNKASIQIEPRSCDVVLGALYVGNFRNAESKLSFRNTNGNKQKVIFSRTDGEPALIQFCSNDRVTAKSASVTFANSVVGVEFSSGVIIDGGWDGIANNCPQATFDFSAPYFSLPEGKTLLLRNFSKSRSGEGTSFSRPFTGAGLVWNRSAANFNWTGGSLSGFRGTLRDSGHDAASFGYQAPLFIRSPGTNTLAEVIGFVPANSDANPSITSKGAGVMQTGFNQAYRDTAIHPDPWFTGRGLRLHGGAYVANAVEQVWGFGVADKKIGSILSLSGGLNFLSRSWSRDQLSGYPINWVEFKSLVHEDKSSLVLWGDFWTNGDVSSADKIITIAGSGTSETIPAGSVRTNHVTILEGISSYAVGPAGDPLATAAHPVVPWIIFPADSSSSGWNNFDFGAFDADDRLVIPVRASVTTLADPAAAGADAKIDDRNIAISSDVTVNSLMVNNQNKGKTLGAGRKLTVSSGGLILHGAGAIGTKDGGDANGSLLLGDADHPAYVWARGKASSPNQIWADVTAPGGFVAAYTGCLTLGGNQRNIADEVAVNAGTLALGDSDHVCQLAPKLPVRVFAGATLSLPNSASLAKNILKFDGSAGWFGKVDIPSGVTAKCKKLYVRDYPEAPEWQNLARGTYGSSESSALYARDDLFTGAGVLDVEADDTIQPTMLIMR